MIRAICLAALGGMLFAFPAFPAFAIDHLPSFDETLASMSDEDATAYTLTRCAGLFMAEADALSRMPAEQALFERTLDLSKGFAGLAANWQGRGDVLGEIVQVATVYGSQIAANRADTGNTVAGIVKTDLEFCGEMARALF